MARHLTDGEREILAEQERDAREYEETVGKLDDLCKRCGGLLFYSDVFLGHECENCGVIRDTTNTEDQ